MSDLGSKENPLTHAPADWRVNGVPYGAWCKCSKCGLVHRSTITFDCYAKGPGVPLVCENCEMGRNWPPGAREEFEKLALDDKQEEIPG